MRKYWQRGFIWMVTTLHVLDFYPPEGQPRSTSDEFPSRTVFGNSWQFMADSVFLRRQFENEPSRRKICWWTRQVCLYLPGMCSYILKCSGRPSFYYCSYRTLAFSSLFKRFQKCLLLYLIGGPSNSMLCCPVTLSPYQAVFWLAK